MTELNPGIGARLAAIAVEGGARAGDNVFRTIMANAKSEIDILEFADYDHSRYPGAAHGQIDAMRVGWNGSPAKGTEPSWALALARIEVREGIRARLEGDQPLVSNNPANFRRGDVLMAAMRQGAMAAGMSVERYALETLDRPLEIGDFAGLYFLENPAAAASNISMARVGWGAKVQPGTKRSWLEAERTLESVGKSKPRLFTKTLNNNRHGAACLLLATGAETGVITAASDLRCQIF